MSAKKKMSQLEAELDAKIREEVLAKIVGEAPGAELLAIPGVGELLEDHFAPQVDIMMAETMAATKETAEPFMFNKEIVIDTGVPAFDHGFVRFMKILRRIVEAAEEKLVFNRSVDFTVGKKYVRVIAGDITEESPDELSHKSVYCFVNMENGDILKPAGWAGPAKHARGNIYDPEDKLRKCCGRHGVAYLRR